MRPESQPRTYYVIWLLLLGFILGLPFVVLGSAIAILLAALPPSIESLILVQTSQPLIWIIDTIPFLLAFSLGILGNRLDASQRLRWQASRAIRAREAEIERLNREVAAQETARKQLDVVIGRGKRDWEATFDAIDDLILITDAEGKVLRCNRATSQAFQRGFEDLVGRQIENLFFGHPEGGEFPIPADKLEMKFPQLAGWYEVSAFPIEVEESRAATIYIIRNITARLETLQDLTRQMEYYQTLVRSCPFAIVTLNMEGRIVACNPAFEKLFGYPEKEVLGQDIDLLVSPPESLAETRALTQAVRRGGVVHAVAQRKKKGAAPGMPGEAITVEVYGIPMVLRGKQIGILAFYHDISQLPSLNRGESWQGETFLEKEESTTPPSPAEAIPAEGELSSPAEPVTALAEAAEITMQPPAQEGLPPTAEADMSEAPSSQTREGDEPGAGTPEMISAELRESILRITPLTTLEEIDSAFVAKLNEQGIYSIEDLLKAAAAAEGRQSLAATTGLPPKQIRRWVHLVDLMRVSGLRKDYLPWLEAAGVESLAALQICQPQNLFEELQRIIKEKKPELRIPPLEEVAAWITAANQTEPLVH